MSLYRVIGTHAYNRLSPGTIFHASLEPDAERRAIERGALEILDATPPGIRPGSYQPPPGWHTNELTEAPTGRLSH